jgi:hypothetical protein
MELWITLERRAATVFFFLPLSRLLLYASSTLHIVVQRNFLSIDLEALGASNRKEVKGHGVCLPALQSHHKTKPVSSHHRRCRRGSAQYDRMLFVRATRKEAGASRSKNEISENSG